MDSPWTGNKREEQILFDFEGPEKGTQNLMWGFSSAGRAPALQAGGHRFEPDYLHQKKKMGLQLSWLERTTDNREVDGSSPFWPTM